MLQYGDVIRVLAKKEFKLRYRNSALGFLWSLFNPLLMMAILTLVFSVLLRSGIPNFPAFVLVGLLAWRFFSISTTLAAWSIVGNPSLITKVYIPRYIVVLSNNVANILGSSLEFLVLLPLLFLLGVTPRWQLILVPVLLGLGFLMVVGISLMLAALNVFYRDFIQLWDITLQLGFFLSPIIYDASIVPGNYSTLYLLNPITRLIEALRKVILAGAMPTADDFLLLLASGILTMLVGYAIFKRLESRFAEEL